jgi:diguanylate cyclase
MSQTLRVLIVDDSDEDAALLVRRLSRGGFDPEFQRVATRERMRAALLNHTWDVIISDYSMLHFSNLAALSVLHESGLDIPFILVSGTIGDDLAIQAMKAGAHDYVMKGNLRWLTSAVERELREVEVRRSQKRAENWLNYMARYDQLTDLPNRNLLYERLDELLSSNKSFALMLMDLDRFKEINDTIGHQAGDSLLQQVGLRLQKVVRNADTVARLGGDEFGVLLPGLHREAAAFAAQRFVKALDTPFIIGEIAMTVKTSIGVALCPEHGAARDSLMRYADIAMYLAKETGGGYAIYSPERDTYSTERLALMADLHRAIEQNQLFLVYQPKLDLKTGAVTGVEALARWQHPKGGLIPPDQFISLAERSGFIKTLTAWGLEAALIQSRSWAEQGWAVPVSVNLSARTLHDDSLPDRVQDLLATHEVRPEQLELEITESAIMVDPARALDILTRLSRMGIFLSIDDFGTGYSSLSCLKKLPVNAVKIDKSFIIHMTEDKNDEQIVRSTIDLAHNLGLKVIAEGVENEAAWHRLLGLGCDEAQGYYLSRPLAPHDLTKWILESRNQSQQVNAMAFLNATQEL